MTQPFSHLWSHWESPNELGTRRSPRVPNRTEKQSQQESFRSPWPARLPEPTSLGSGHVHTLTRGCGVGMGVWPAEVAKVGVGKASPLVP